MPDEFLKENKLFFFFTTVFSCKRHYRFLPFPWRALEHAVTLALHHCGKVTEAEFNHQFSTLLTTKYKSKEKTGQFCCNSGKQILRTQNVVSGIVKINWGCPM